MHVALVYKGGQFAEHGLQCSGFDAGGVIRDQRGETGQRAELQSPLVLPQERPQHGQSLGQDGQQVDLDGDRDGRG